MQSDYPSPPAARASAQGCLSLLWAALRYGNDLRPAGRSTAGWSGRRGGPGARTEVMQRPDPAQLQAAFHRKYTHWQAAKCPKSLSSPELVPGAQWQVLYWPCTNDQVACIWRRNVSITAVIGAITRPLRVTFANTHIRTRSSTQECRGSAKCFLWAQCCAKCALRAISRMLLFSDVTRSRWCVLGLSCNNVAHFFCFLVHSCTNVILDHCYTRTLGCHCCETLFSNNDTQMHSLSTQSAVV